MTSGFDLVDLKFTFMTPKAYRSTNKPKFRKRSFLTLLPKILTLMTSGSLLRPWTPQQHESAKTCKSGKRYFFLPCELRFTYRTPEPHRSMGQPNWDERSFCDLVTSGFDLDDLRFAFETA